MSNLRCFFSLLAGICLVSLGWAQDYVPGEVLVKFKNPSVIYTASALGSDATLQRTIAHVDINRYKLARGISVNQALVFLRRLSYVEYAEPNYIVRAFETPNDPQFPSQWNLSKIRCEAGWDLTHGSSSVVIAIIDTGVDLTHPDLEPKLVQGTDIRNGDTVPQDDNGHGSHVAGIAAAATNNNIGVAGVGWDCKIMPVKVLGSTGSGSLSDAAEGVVWAADHGAKVENLSLGSPSGTSTMANAVSYAWTHNVLVVAAAGNDGSYAPNYPAGYDNAIAVGASDPNDVRAEFSNFGSWVDVAAPGTGIPSTYKDGGYRVLSGTSMACPHVAGLGALLWSTLGTGTDVSVIRQRIEDNTVPVGTWVAHGRIDVVLALNNSGPPSIVRVVAPLTNAFLVDGTVVGGGFSSLLSSDDDRLNILSTLTAFGRRVDYYATATPVWPGDKIALQTVVEASGTPSTKITVSFWNWNQTRWDPVGTAVFGSADHVFTFQSGNPDLYVAGNGDVRVEISRTEPRNRLFWIRTDKVEIASLSSGP
jgi:thermitase